MDDDSCRLSLCFTIFTSCDTLFFCCDMLLLSEDSFLLLLLLR